MPTEKRIERITRVLSFRQPDLRVVLEGVTIAHNASAVVRTCDAAGVLYLDVISPNPDLVEFNKAITTRAEKWMSLRVHSSPAACFPDLKKAGLKIAATHLSGDSVSYTDLDYTQPLALVFGSESEGISEESLQYADFKIRIPMVGMVQSLNLSVSVGIILYEAFRQRREKGYFERRRLAAGEFDAFLRKWLKG